MKELIKRTATGVIFVTLIIASLLWVEWMFLPLCAVFTFLCAWECYILIEGSTRRYSPLLIATVAVVFFMAATTFINTGYKPKWGFILLPILLLIPIFGLFSRKPTEGIRKTGGGILSVLFTALPFAALIGIKMFSDKVEQGTLLLLAFFVTTWCYDTFAYLTGSLLGKHKLCKNISPKKTWEGAIGGTLFAIGCSYLFAQFTSDLLSTSQWILFGIIICIFGTFGDLSESLLKRQRAVKDSGNILPGHGGMLDRLDSVIFAAPFILAYLHWLP